MTDVSTLVDVMRRFPASPQSSTFWLWLKPMSEASGGLQQICSFWSSENSLQAESTSLTSSLRWSALDEGSDTGTSSTSSRPNRRNPSEEGDRSSEEVLLRTSALRRLQGHQKIVPPTPLRGVPWLNKSSCHYRRTFMLGPQAEAGIPTAGIKVLKLN